MAELVLSRRNLADMEVLKDAEAELQRAEGGGDAALAQWARDWGRPALIALDAAHAKTEDRGGFDPWN